MCSYKNIQIKSSFPDSKMIQVKCFKLIYHKSSSGSVLLFPKDGSTIFFIFCISNFGFHFRKFAICKSSQSELQDKCHINIHNVKQSEKKFLCFKHLKLHTVSEHSEKLSLCVCSLALCLRRSMKMNSLVFAKYSYLHQGVKGTYVL